MGSLQLGDPDVLDLGIASGALDGVDTVCVTYGLYEDGFVDLIQNRRFKMVFMAFHHVNNHGNFGPNHQCSNVLKCANCQLEHHSLDPRCDVIRRYRTDLNKAVNMAISEGKLHRREIPQQQFQPTTFRYN
ncbi:unnamed protein product, partial [Didymodactylos carnosus]